jgi:hypothetical protein
MTYYLTKIQYIMQMKWVLSLLMTLVLSGIFTITSAQVSMDEYLRYQEKERDFEDSIRAKNPDITREELKSIMIDFARKNDPVFQQQENNTSKAVARQQMTTMALDEGDVPNYQEFLALKALYQGTDGDNWYNRANLNWPTSAEFDQMLILIIGKE